MKRTWKTALPGAAVLVLFKKTCPPPNGRGKESSKSWQSSTVELGECNVDFWLDLNLRTLEIIDHPGRGGSIDQLSTPVDSLTLLSLASRQAALEASYAQRTTEVLLMV